MKVVLKRTAIATSPLHVWRCCRSVGLNSAEFRWGSRAPRRGSIDRRTRVDGVARRQSRRFASGDRLLAAAVAATTTPRNYDDYDCYGDPYAGRGYPPGYYYSSYPGGYCVSRDYSTGLYTRPTLFPRYYGGWVR